MLALLTTVALAAPTHAQIEAAKWAQIATREHADAGTVVVYEASVAGMPCFKGVATTAAPVDKLLEVIADVPSATRWSTAGLTKSELLKKSGSTLEYWQYLDIPNWTMASDRFWFVSATVVNAGTSASLKWNEMAKGGGAYATKFQEIQTANPDALEPSINIGGWYFKAEDGHSKVEYMVCTDPGGSIPVAIQAAAERRTLPDTVGDLVREAKKRAGL